MLMKWLEKVVEEKAHLKGREWNKWLRQYKKEASPWERIELAKDISSHGRKITVRQLKEAMVLNESWLGKKILLSHLWEIVADKHNFFELLELCRTQEEKVDIRIVCRH